MGNKKTQENIAKKTQEKLNEAIEKANQALLDAEDTAPQTTNNATGTVNTNDADLVSRQGTQSQQNAVNKATSYNTNTSVSNQQGRSENYVENNFKPEDQAAFTQQYSRLHPGYMVNDNGEVVRDPNASLYDALQIDREKLRGERNRQERIQRLRKLEHGLANSAMLISDMITAGIGGNVYKRDKDKTNEETDKEIAGLKEAQIADDIAAKIQDYQERSKWAADYWKEFNERRKEQQRHISENSSNGMNQSVQQGRQINTSQQSNKSNTVQATNYGDNYGSRKYGSYYGGGRGNGQTEIVKIPTGNNGTIDIHMPKGEYESTGRYLSALYSALGKADGNNIKQVLSKANIKPQKDGTYDGAALLSSGIIFDDPKVRQEFEKAIWNDPKLSQDSKIKVIEDMTTYAITKEPEEKIGLWERIKGWFTGKEQPANDEFNGLFVTR